MCVGVDGKDQSTRMRLDDDDGCDDGGAGYPSIDPIQPKANPQWHKPQRHTSPALSIPLDGWGQVLDWQAAIHEALFFWGQIGAGVSRRASPAPDQRGLECWACELGVCCCEKQKGIDWLDLIGWIDTAGSRLTDCSCFDRSIQPNPHTGSRQQAQEELLKRKRPPPATASQAAMQIKVKTLKGVTVEVAAEASTLVRKPIVL
jgi:hypothetical protein